MSIFLDLLHGKITWGQAVSETVNWGDQVIAAVGSTQSGAAAISSVKQGLSNAIATGETALSPHIIPAVESVEKGLDAALIGATGGFAVFLTPMLDATISNIAETVKSAADAWALRQRASAAASPKPQSAPVPLASIDHQPAAQVA